METWWPALHPLLPFILADPNLALELSGYRPIEVLRDFARMWRSRSGRRDPGGAASFGGERRCVEFPRGNSISLPRAGKGSMTSPRPHSRFALKTSLIGRGTGSSNPLPSSGESVANSKRHVVTVTTGLLVGAQVH
jgi:hypothetical protein